MDLEESALKPIISHRLSSNSERFAIPAFLAIICLALYHSTLSGGWRFDDGSHLNFAISYAPWQYFFVPEILRLQSGANLTPWNALFYDLNLSFFGLNPAGFYFHQLVILWLTSVATYLLLRLWITPLWALVGAVMFLIGAPTAYIANQIMTGHYSSGLLFSVAALYCYIRAVREQSIVLILTGAFLYLLTVTCKEVYVPLVIILPFLPVGSLKTRLRYLLPFLLVILIYIPWRYLVLGRLFGGYNLSSSYDLTQIMNSFIKLPMLLFGDDLLGMIAFVIVALLMMYAIFLNKYSWQLILLSASALLLPLVSLVNFPGITAPDRYLFAVWWGLSILSACALSSITIKHDRLLAGFLGIALIGISFMHLRHISTQIIHFVASTEKSYEFMLTSNSHQSFLAPDFQYDYGQCLTHVVAAQKKMHPSAPERAMIIPDFERLASLDLNQNQVWTYNDNCLCMEDVSSTIPDRVADYQNRLTEKTLSVRVKMKPLKISWEFEPYFEGEYRVMLNDLGLYHLPRSGAYPYALEALEGYILYYSPQGWITKSPRFRLHLHDQPEWIWSRS